MKFFAYLLLPVVLFCQEAPKLRLPGDAQPIRYELDLTLDPGKDGFEGTVGVQVQIVRSTPVIWLNSSGLTIKSATVDGKPGRVVEGNSDFVGVAADKPFNPGTAKVQLVFSGTLQTTDVEGLFKQTENGNSYIMTQFEPISARRAFPCFDEPALKTPWRVTLRVPKGMEAFANTPEESQQAEGEYKVVRFRESKPMPSYLVAMAVGPFDIIDGGKAGKKQTPLRIVAVKGHRDEAKYALEVTPKVFAALENYFGVPYPYEKLDQITIPVTVAFGAMENAGLITYQSSLLLVRPQDDTPTRRRLNADVITHEIAHQWFGNMVSPKWWDDIWLNEAFATWMTNYIIDQQFPEWKTQIGVAAKKSSVMTTDSLLSARKIRQPIASSGDIGSAFDDITYQKGSAVIRMFENYVGPELFRKGIQNYMKKHAWGAATARDFLAAISQASGKDVTSAFSTFLDRTGVPLLKVNLNCGNGKPAMVVSQERFLPLGSKGSRSEYWQTPACFEYESNGKIVRQCNVIADPKDTVALNAANGCPAWVNANAEGAGYYRISYEGGLQDKLIENAAKLSIPEQVDLLANTAALVGAGQMPASQALALVAKFKDSDERGVLLGALDIALKVENSLEPDLRANYARFMLKTFGPKARALGWQPKPGESEDHRLMRAKLVPITAEYGDQELMAEAGQLAKSWLNDRNSVNPDIATAVLQTAAIGGDQLYFNRLVAELKKTTDRRDRNRIIGAIGSFQNPAIAQQGLNLVLDKTFDIRDMSELLYEYNNERQTDMLAWPFLKAHYDEVLSRLPSRLGNHAGSELPKVGGAFCDTNGYSEVESFFKDRAKTMPGAELTLAQVLEKISLCGPRRAALRPELAKFLKDW